MSNFPGGDPLVAFDGLTVNPDYEVLAGNMVTITDPVLRQKIADARNNKDASKENAQKVEEKKYNQPVNSVVVVTGTDGKPQLNSKGQPIIKVTLADGTSAEMPVTENIRIVGSDGKEVYISKDGTMTPADGKPVTPPAAIALTDPTKLGDGSITIKFSAAADQKFGFDGVTGGDGIWGRDNFKIGGATYYVPIKSIHPGVEDYVTFEQQGAGTTKFSLEMNGKATPVTPSGNRITLNIPFVGNASLFALNDKNEVVGKLTILSYPMVTKKVVLVGLNKNGTPSASDLENRLNDIFKHGIATVKVEAIEFTSTTYKGIMNAERDHYKYSNDMQAIVSEFKKQYTPYTSDPNTVYLFFGKSDQANLGGVMNRGYQFGFIFENDPKVIAHELGHGIFRLQHTSDDNSNGKAVGNLMDYSPGGTTLYKYQWTQMQNPPSVWPIMESPDDAEYQTDGHYSTVYLIGLMLGLPNAKEIAFWTEYPDYIIHDKKAEVRTTWAESDHQKLTHALTNGYHSEEEFMTAVAIMNSKDSDLQELGRLLHRYGDTYAHTVLSDRVDSPIPISQKRMYGEEIPFIHWTYEHAYADSQKGNKSEPDLIKNDPKWYLRYVRNISEILSLKYGKNASSVNMSVFDNIANYAKNKQVSLIGIINYEIAKFKGDKSFTIPYPVVEEGASAVGYILSGVITHFSEIPDYHIFVKNAEDYLKTQGIAYKMVHANELVQGTRYKVVIDTEAVFLLTKKLNP